MDEREHLIIVRKGRYENVLSAKCAGCGAELDRPDSWHPEAACLLTKNGIDPVAFVTESASRIRRHDSSYGSHPAVRAARAIPMMAAK